MDRLSINLGNQNNDGLGDGIRDAFIKVNSNFAELFNSNNMGASQAAVDTVSAALSNEISARQAASAVLESHINVVSATINSLSANQVSVVNKISTILNSNTALTGTTYSFTAATNSDSTSTGTVVVAGGLGVAGNIHVGTLFTDDYRYANGDPFAGGGGGGSGTVGSGTTGQLAYYLNTGTSVLGSPNLVYDGERMTVSSGNVATSTSTGAIVVTGGVGVSGNIYVGGSLNFNGNDVSATFASVNQSISVISQQVSVISNKVSVLNVSVAAEISARIAASATLEAHIAQVSALVLDSSAINAAVSALSNSVSSLNTDVFSAKAYLSSRLDSAAVVQTATNNAVSIVSNAVSVVSAAAASVETHVNTVSNAVSAVSAQLVSVDKKLSDAISALSQSVSATYAPKASPTFSGNVTLSSNVTLSGGTTTGVLYLNGGNIITTGSTLAFDSSGRLLVNSNSTAVAQPSSLQKFQVATTTSPVTASFLRYSNNTTGLVIGIGKSRGTTIGTAGAVVAGDVIGSLSYFADNGTNLIVAGSLTGVVESVPGDGNVAGALAFYTTTSSGTTAEAVRIDSTGKVGIGTNSPTETLAVSSSNTKPARIKSLSASNNNKLVLETAGVGSTMGVWVTNSYGNTSISISETSGALALATGGSNTGGSDSPAERVRIDSTGNVGIGTSSPGALLDVFGASGARIKFGVGSGLLLNQISSGGDAYVNQQANNSLVLATNNTERMRINASGNVGIGTNSPTYVLDVTGNARFTANVTAPYFLGNATQAVYADVAEKYTADANYDPGTVVQLGTDTEVTASNIDATTKVVGVISTNPAYLMNTGLTGNYVVQVALLGRVPCKIKGPVNKGDLLVATDDGRARVETHPKVGSLVGKALDDFYGDDGTIEVLVGVK